MKTPEELKALKEEVEALNKKLAELDEDELAEVSGGIVHGKTSGGNGIVRRIQKDFQCPVCGRWFITPEDVAEHIGKEHTGLIRSADQELPEGHVIT